MPKEVFIDSIIFLSNDRLGFIQNTMKVLLSVWSIPLISICMLFLCVIHGLVVEVPTDAKTHAGWVHRIARPPEITSVRLVRMVVHDVESCAFQVKVGI